MNETELTKDFVLGEVKKLQYLYRLKTEVRYGQTRPLGDLTESVAEHIYGMHILAQYFLPLEDPKKEMNHLKIYKMITLHDVDEIETGDYISYLKTDENRKAGTEALKVVIQNLPEHIQKEQEEIINEYETQKTKETVFVKAIDRFEPLIQMYSDFGKAIMQINKQSSCNSVSIKEPYLRDFPYMYKYFQIIEKAFIDEKYFYHEVKN